MKKNIQLQTHFAWLHHIWYHLYWTNISIVDIIIIISTFETIMSKSLSNNSWTVYFQLKEVLKSLYHTRKLSTKTTTKKTYLDLSYIYSSKTFKMKVRIHKNEQLLDWPFARLLLEALCIKTSNYLQVKGIDLWS